MVLGRTLTPSFSKRFGRRHCSGLIVAAVAAVVGISSVAKAAPFYWDTDAAALVQPGSGTWGTNTFWTQNGTTLAGWTSGGNAIFAGAGATASSTVFTNAGTDGLYNGASSSYLITLGSALTASSVVFTNTGFYLTAPTATTLTLSINNSTSGAPTATNTALWVAAGKTAGIGNNVTLALTAGNYGSRIGLDNGATLNIDAGAKIDKTTGTSRDLVFGSVTSAVATINVAGTITRSVTGDIAGIVFGNNAGEVDVNVLNGGIISTTSTGATNSNGSIALGNSSGAKGVLTMQAGSTVTASDTDTSHAQAGLKIGTVSGATGIMNLNGGTLTVQKVFTGSTGASSTFNFNGGTLTANTSTATFMQGLTNAFIKSGGAIIDDGGNTITIAQSLLTDTVSTGGGLTKKGYGTLTLSGANTYTGTTNITAGTLAVTGSLSGAGALIMAAGTGLSNASNGSTLNFNGNASFGGGATLTLNVVNSSSTLSTVGMAVTGAITTAHTPNGILLNVTPTSGSWATGINDLISFGSLDGGASLSDFTLGFLAGSFTSRQVMPTSLTVHGNNLAIVVEGDHPVWTGLANDGLWSTASTGDNGTGPTNWATATGRMHTQFWSNDDAEFRDTYDLTAEGGGTGTVTQSNINIDSSGVYPRSTSFNNNTVDYTLSSTSGSGIFNTGTLTKSGAASLTINTTNWYTGGTTFNGGTLNLGNANALGTGPLAITPGNAKVLNNTSGSDMILYGISTQTWNDDFTFAGTNALDMGGGIVTLSGATRTVTVNNGSILKVGRITSAAASGIGLTVNGTGTLAINTSDGSTNGNSSIDGTLTVSAGATLQINTGVSATTTADLGAGGVAGSGNVMNGGGVARAFVINNATDMTSTLHFADGTGGGALIVRKGGGSGTLTLSGASTYTGNTEVASGVLYVTGLGAQNSLNFLVSPGTTANGILRIDPAATISPMATITIGSDGGTVGSLGRLELSGNQTLSNAIFYQPRNDTGNSDGIRNVSGNNTLSGLMTLQTGGSQTRIRSDSGMLTLSGGITTDSTSARNLFLVGDGDGLVSGVISDNPTNVAGKVNVTKAGNGTWTITGNATTTGTTTISAGTLQVGNGGSTGALGSGAVVNNATLTFNRTGTVTVPGALSGTGVINQNNSGGSVILSNASGTNTLNVNAGKLNVTGTVAAINVANDASVAIANGGATGTGALTATTLTFNGIGQISPHVAAPNAIATITVGTLTTTPANGLITINPYSPVWSVGLYNLIGYTSFNGSLTNFTLGALAGGSASRASGTSLVANGNNIALNITAIDSPRWTGADDSQWGTGLNGVRKNFKLVSGGTATDYIEGDVVLFDDSATNKVVNINASVAPASTTFNNSAGNDYVLQGGSIAGIGSLTKNGAGTLTMNNGSNAYTGGTTINAGTIVMGNSMVIPGALTMNGGKLDLHGNSYTTPAAFSVAASAAITNNMANTTATLTFNSTGATTYALSLTNGTAPNSVLALTKTGDSAVTFSGTSNYTGGTNINNNQITLTSNTGLGLGPITLNTGTNTATRLTLGNGVVISNDINLASTTGNTSNGLITGPTASDGSATAVISGNINITASPSAGGHFNGGDNLTLSGNITSSVDVLQRTGTITYTGTGSNFYMLRESGTARLGANNALPTAATVELGTSANGTLDLAGFNQTLTAIQKGGNGGTVGNSSTISDSTLTITGYSSYAGVITNAVSGGTMKVNLTVGNQGYLTLTGANTYSGTTTINSGGTLYIGDNVTAGAGTLGTGPVVNEGTLYFYRPDAFTVSNAISGTSGTININASSTSVTTLTGTSTYTGVTNLNSGKLVVNGAFAGTINANSGTLDGTGTVGGAIVGSGAVVANGNGSTKALTVGALTLNGQSKLNLTVSPTSPTSVALATTTLTAIGGTNSVTIDVAPRGGIWALGTTYNLVSYGTLNDSTAFTTGTIPGLSTRNTASLDFSMPNLIRLNIAGTAIVWNTGSGDWATGLTNNIWKQQSDNASTNFLDFDQVVFNEPTSATTVNISSGFISTSGITFNNTTNSYTISSVSGFGIASGILVKNGDGALTINTSNSYTGGTTFMAGKLNIGNAAALGSGTFTIETGSSKTLNNTSGSAIVMTGVTAQNWNDDFTFAGISNLDMGTGAVTLGGSGTDRIVNVAAGTLTVGELIGGSYGLTKQGSGTLIITNIGAGNAGSVIGGALNVAAGTLQLNRTGVTGGDAVSGDFTTTFLTGTGTIINGAGEARWLFVNNSVDDTFAGSLKDGPSGGYLGLNKSGTGTLTLAGANSFSDPLTINAGKVVISGTNVDIPSATTTPNAQILAGTLVLANPAAMATNSLVRFGAVGGTLQYASDTPGNTYALTMGSGFSGTVISDRATPGAAINRSLTTGSNNGVGGGTITFVAGTNVTSGIANVSFDAFNMGAGSVQTTTLNPIVNANGVPTTLTIGTVQKSNNTPNQTIGLDGTTSGNQITGPIGNGTATVSVLKSNTSVWTLSGANTYSGGTAVNAGTLIFASASARPAGDILTLGSQTIGSSTFGGKVAIVGDAANQTSYVSAIIAAYNGGTWTGTSTIRTAGTAGTQGIGYMTGTQWNNLNGNGAGFASGYTVDAADMLLRYTWMGDADLDGRITPSDYAQLDAGFLFGQYDNVTRTARWTNGDFNYDGLVDYRDYAAMDAAFAVQSGPLANEEIALHTAQFGAPYTAVLDNLMASAVPEPASLTLLSLGAIGLLRRNRRK